MIVFIRIFSANSRQKKSLAITNRKKTWFIGLEDIEYNGVSDWFRTKARDGLRAHLRCKRESFSP